MTTVQNCCHEPPIGTGLSGSFVQFFGIVNIDRIVAPWRMWCTPRSGTGFTIPPPLRWPAPVLAMTAT